MIAGGEACAEVWGWHSFDQSALGLPGQSRFCREGLCRVSQPPLPEDQCQKDKRDHHWFSESSHSTPAPMIKGPPMIKWWELHVPRRCDWQSLESWEEHKCILQKKGFQRLYSLHRINAFNVVQSLMVLLYWSFIESILAFCFISLNGNLSVQSRTFCSSPLRLEVLGAQSKDKQIQILSCSLCN